jgi:hypothetical protein
MNCMLFCQHASPSSAMPTQYENWTQLDQLKAYTTMGLYYYFHRACITTYVHGNALPPPPSPCQPPSPVLSIAPHRGDPARYDTLRSQYYILGSY